MAQTSHGLSLADGFAKMAALYEEAFPQVTVYAKKSIDAAPAITSDSVVHDNGCGPGVISGVILANFKGTAVPKITATDVNSAMIAEAAKRSPQIDARVMDSKNLHIPDGTFSHSFSNFLLSAMFPAEVNIAFASEIRRTMAPGGTVDIAAWYLLEWFTILEDAANAVRSDGATFVPKNEYEKEVFQDALVKGGFAADDMEMSPHGQLGEPLNWDSEALQLTVSMIGPMVTKTWSEEEQKLFVAKLNERMDQDRVEKKRFKMVAWIVAAKC